MREGIEKYFRIRAAAEIRDMDVYVLTAPSGTISATRTSSDEPGSFGWVDIQTPVSAPDNFIGFSDPLWRRDGDQAPTEDELSSLAGEFLKSLAGGWKRGTASIRGMSAASTVAQLCEMLEATVDRPVIDETNLDGTYESQRSHAGRKRRTVSSCAVRSAGACGHARTAQRQDARRTRRYLKLFTASASLSWHSNTVSSFVIDSRSLMRLVVFNSFKAPPPLFIVA